MTENNYISKRSLNLVRLFVLLLILLDLYYAVIQLFMPELSDFSGTFEIVKQFVVSICVVYIWIIIRQIIVKGQGIVQLNIYLTWQIWLFIITGILLIFMQLRSSRSIELLTALLSFVGIVIYAILAIKVIRLSKDKLYFIKNFKNYLVAYIIVVLLSLIRMLISAAILYPYDYLSIDTTFIDNFLKTIPLIFLFIYFTEYKRSIHLRKNASA